MAQALNASISHMLHRANQVATDRFAKEIGDNDVTLRQLIVLAAIDANDGVSQTGIVAATGIDRSTLADLVRRLVRRGLISRQRTKDDARAYAVRLTAEGRQMLSVGMPVMEHVETEMLASLPVKMRAELVAALGVLVSGAQP